MSLRLVEGQQRRNQTERPQTYFELMARVGDSGRYQFIIMLIFLIMWFVTGIILLSTAFLFRMRTFNCVEHGLLLSQTNCQEYVCKLPEQQWLTYLSTKDNDFTTLATLDNNDLCDNTIVVDLVSSCTYFGAFVGYIVISFLADNFGRKKSIVISWIICTVGTIIVAFSPNVYLAAVGLFCCGFGSDAAINICFFFFGEVVGEDKREKYSVVVQVLFTTGAIAATFFYSIMSDWKIIWFSLVVGPAVIQVILLLCYVQETPQFLVKEGVNQTLRVLNKIGRINCGEDDLLEEQDVANVMDYQLTQQFQGKLITPLDLIRFPSLRVVTISCCIISFMTYAMYYGPVLIIDDIGFDIYISSYMVNLSQLLVFIPAFFLIQNIKRKKLGIILFTVAVLCSLVLLFVTKPQDCDMCIQSIIELVLIFIFRACVSFFFCFFQVYFCELYPARARGIGAGIVSAVGTLGSTISPIYLGIIKKQGISVMAFFVVFGILAIGCLTLLYETKGLPLKEQIDEIAQAKVQRRTQIIIERSIMKTASFSPKVEPGKIQQISEQSAQ